MREVTTSENKSFVVIDAGIEQTLDKCSNLLKERTETKSIFCSKLDQWLSAKHCMICRFNDHGGANP